ncbi:MAG: chromosomal replication initiator protein DnaA [Betaproteobacteria bacterium]|uniref:Chromosomal replication initiator protein DnaA n=1 Tax=Candidatus Proximibacter danicus TaxID=2954365 RepID=A0A9D7PT35_9PROT|nr:chromosomal replication initiator protein DnaA [Candidatus Proximibacter danicus]
MSSFWNSCLSQFEQELPLQQFNTWIRPLRLEGEDNFAAGLRLIAPNGFIMKWVKERYLTRIEELGQVYFDAPVSIALTLGERKTTAAPARVETRAQATTPKAADVLAAALPAAKSSSNSYEKTRLISSFTFDNLVVGKANDLARAAAMQVAQNPGGAYNPLFIYGGAGLGKTHLIHAIGNTIIDQHPQKVVRYVHAEAYYSDVVRAYQQKSFDVFKRYYRSLDVLLVDDVQFFNGKNRTQEEFFYVFNALIEARKQIVISCDTYPKDISGLEDRLITRFDWGLTVQIEPPETEMRVAILKKKAEAEGVALDDEVAFVIAKHLRSNVRELEGALKKVLAYSSFHGREIALDLVKEALKDVIGAVNRQITVENIQKTVADYYKMKVADLFSPKRTRAIARPRQVAMWLAKDLTAHSYPMIGDAFGGRDHTTVLHAVRKIDSLRTKDNELNHDLHVLLQVLKG